jgi:hypothetical protein
MRIADAPAADRVRDAILLANQRIFERSTLEPQLKGMACVLTLAFVSDGALTVGHVGDSRLYKLTAGGSAVHETLFPGQPRFAAAAWRHLPSARFVHREASDQPFCRRSIRQPLAR